MKVRGWSLNLDKSEECGEGSAAAMANQKSGLVLRPTWDLELMRDSMREGVGDATGKIEIGTEGEMD